MKKATKNIKILLLLAVCVFAFLLSACSSNEKEKTEGDPTPTVSPSPESEKPTSIPTRTPGRPGETSKPTNTDTNTSSESISSLAKEQNKKEDTTVETKDLELWFYADGTYEFKQKNKFYNEDIKLTIICPEGSSVYYTMDGTEPQVSDTLYKEPLQMKAKGGKFPDAYTLRACAIDKDGNKSDVAARSYLVGRNLDSRFSTLVFFVSGDPAELTEAPDGILYNENALNRGREYERKVFIEAFEADGSLIFEQYGGVRAYGGYSRRYTIKSLKLFARSSYDAGHKNFKIDAFGTPKLYEVEEGKSTVITKYDKLVLRNGGNDYQFAYIRDELSQRLCKAAGFETYEEVLPVVIYLNGKYYSLFWLHENYCDKYFKEKYGDADGEFIIAEGTDQLKNDDEEIQYYIDEYNEKYEYYSEADLTNDSIYNILCEFIDVNSYLDFFAWNIALNNWDWPNNNFKCFKYIPDDLVSFGDGVFDGKWRFLPHDMDYTYNLYDQAKTKENYNTLRVVLDENNERYSPLFKKLMQRKDCRKYFRDKTFEYLNGAQSEKTIKEEYEKLHASRAEEMKYFYDFLQVLRQRGYWDIWAQASNYAGYEQQIYTFAEKRASYVVKYMDDLLPELE